MSISKLCDGSSSQRTSSLHSSQWPEEWRPGPPGWRQEVHRALVQGPTGGFQLAQQALVPLAVASGQPTEQQV